ncbi:hypothetical protein HQ447_01740 [bacterium]|nr:hypothetical protein [bacterium]
MKTRFAFLLLALADPGRAQTTLDFTSSAEGFTDSLAAGGGLTRVTDTGGGSLRLTNPAAWTWRASADFQKSGSGKSREIALALGTAAQSGGFLHFDIIVRPATAATAPSGGFWGVQYLVAVNQAIPGGANGWVQKMAFSLPASAFPPTAERVIPVSVPLKPWTDSSDELRLHPASAYYQIHFGSNSGGVSQVEWHIDNLRVETPPAQPGAIQLEAESGILTGLQVASAASGFNGTGYVTNFDQVGDQVSWNFNAPAGVHRLQIRYRSPGGMKGFAGALNGSGISGTFPANASFASFDAGLVELTAGTNKLTLGGGWNYYEIDSATMIPEAPAAAPTPGPAIPVDPAATPAARSLLASIASNYGLKTYSGQHDADDLPLIQSLSGKLPAILAGDLIDYSPTRVEHAGLPANVTESLITQAGEGHILSVMWHWNAPSGLLNTPAQPWWRGFYTEATTFDLAAALADPNSAHYALILRDIDAIAIQLRKLSQANLPILFRPLHEAEGGWFWWGAKGPAAYKKLWQLLFTRLTQHHGIHNLLWVLTVEDPAWYPGDAVVDVIGVDAYPDDRSDALFSRWEPLRNRFDGVKPIALTEFGGVPDIEKMQRLGIWWSWFCSWQGAQYGPQSAPAATVQRIYQSTAVLTRDELVAAPDPATLDSNQDGVFDVEAAALGFSPALDLGPALSFFRSQAARFNLGHTTAEIDASRLAGRQEILDQPNLYELFTASQVHAIDLGAPFLFKDPASGRFTLNLRLMHSSDLLHWDPITPTEVSQPPGGLLQLKLPAAGNAAFYRVQGAAP